MDYTRIPLNYPEQSSDYHPASLQKQPPTQKKTEKQSTRTTTGRDSDGTEKQHMSRTGGAALAQIPVPRPWTTSISEDKMTQLMIDCSNHGGSSVSYPQPTKVSAQTSCGNPHDPAHVQQYYNPIQVWLNTPTCQQPYNNVGSFVGMDTKGSVDIGLEIREEIGDWWSTMYLDMGYWMGTLWLRATFETRKMRALWRSIVMWERIVSGSRQFALSSPRVVL